MPLLPGSVNPRRAHDGDVERNSVLIFLPANFIGDQVRDTIVVKIFTDASAHVVNTRYQQVLKIISINQLNHNNEMITIRLIC